MVVAIIANLIIMREKDRSRLNAIRRAIKEEMFNTGILLNCEDK
jgi:hypothetical protein